MDIDSAILLIQPYKYLPVTTKILCGIRLLSSFFHFHRTLFCRLEGAFVNPGSFFQTLFLYIHLFV